MADTAGDTRTVGTMQSFEAWDEVADKISPRALAAALIDRGVDPQRLEAAAGGPIASVSPARFEAGIIEAGVISEGRLLALKGMLSGLKVPDGPGIAASPGLSAEVARAAAAVMLDLPSQAVAFVEPSADNVGLVAATLSGPFEVYVTTTGQFRRFYETLYNSGGRPKHTLGGIHWVLEETVRRRASDCHLKVGKPPVLRIDGALVPLAVEEITDQWMERELSVIATPAQLRELESAKTSDFAIEHGGRRFRVNLGAERDGKSAALRLLASRVPSMDELGLPDSIRAFTALERGLVLITGPTGSGKSTLLASVLGHICAHQGRHVITLEDPIEYVLEGGDAAVVNQRELGEHFVDFASAIRQALRQDPDVILVGEMRDPETARAAVTAAETGHLVFSTLHTYDAQSTVARLVSMYPGEEQDHAREKIAYVLRGVVSQTLVPRYNSPGRIAAQEIMLGTPAVANSLRAANGISRLRDTIQTSRKDGMQTMEMALAQLVKQGKVAEPEALFRARVPEEFRRYLHGAD